jgi:AraC family transcriptional regulator
VPLFATDDVTIRDVPETRVAVMTHRGDPARLGETIQRFIAWRRAAGLRPGVSATYNVFPCDPRTTPPADFRLELCAATDRAIAPDDPAVVAGVIPGGRCAVLRVVGASDDLEPAALFLYRDWLPTSGETPRDFPLYCRRLTFFPDVAEHEAITELYLPLT